MTAKLERTFLPAAGHDWFLPLYDPITRLFGFDRARRELLEQAALRPYHRVLDVGCGTGTFAVLIKQVHPNVEVIGLDPDAKALARAERKAFRAGAPVRFDQGFADRLVYGDGMFDRVFSSMMFHHLESGDKENALREMRRVLKPGGRLELVDFDGGHLHHRLKENSERRILELMARAGFEGVKKTHGRATLFGRVGFYQAMAPR